MRGARPGHTVGSLRIPEIGVKIAVVEGTATADLRKGPGHYRSTVLPGLPGTFAVAGHRTTFGAPFRNIDQLRRGSKITVRMPYGTFVYRVTGSQSVSPGDVSVLTAAKGGTSRLVLTACDPPGSAARRLVVTARPVSAS